MKKRVAGRGEVWKGASLRMQLQHHLSAPKKQMHNHQMQNFCDFFFEKWQTQSILKVRIELQQILCILKQHFISKKKKGAGGTAEYKDLRRQGRKRNLSDWCSGKGHIDVVAQVISLGITLSISTKEQTVPGNSHLHSCSERKTIF